MAYIDRNEAVGFVGRLYIFVLKSLAEFEANFDTEYEINLIKTGKIKSLKGDWSGFYRLKLRTYRVIYAKEADKLIILVVRISHRKDVYE